MSNTSFDIQKNSKKRDKSMTLRVNTSEILCICNGKPFNTLKIRQLCFQKANENIMHNITY
jgi:hypothetical protein